MGKRTVSLFFKFQEEQIPVENWSWVEAHSPENMDPQTQNYGTFYSLYMKERENPALCSIILCLINPV